MATFLAQWNSYCYTTNSIKECSKLTVCSYKDRSYPIEYVGKIEEKVRIRVSGHCLHKLFT